MYQSENIQKPKSKERLKHSFVKKKIENHSRPENEAVSRAKIQYLRLSTTVTYKLYKRKG